MTKKQIPVTLEEDLISRLDVMADNEEFRSRSHVVEFLLNKALKKGDGSERHPS